MSSIAPLSFKVEPKTNVLDGLTLYEQVDRATLVKLINSTLLRETFNNKMAGALYKTEKQQLERYLAKMENGRIPITYARNEDNPYGRCNPGQALGLYPIRREIRHTLAGRKMVDIDVKNCHPEMLNQLCEAEGMPHAALDHYVKNRQFYFDKVCENYGCSEEGAKTIFIIYSYGGGFKRCLEKAEIDIAKCHPAVLDGDTILELDVMRDFRESMAPIHKQIAKANPDLCAVVRKLKAARQIVSYNLAGVVCSFVLQEYEVRVIEQIFLYCSNKDLIADGVCVLCADGLMIERRFYDAKLLPILSDLVRRTLGLDLVLTQKEMTKGYGAILDKSLAFDLCKGEYSSGMYAEHFSVMYANKFLCYDGVVYQYNGVTWEALDKKFSALHLFVSGKFYTYMVGYCAIQLSAQNAALEAAETDVERDTIALKIRKVDTLLNNIRKFRDLGDRQAIVSDIIIHITNNSVRFDENPHLFAFKNRVYDLKTNAFVASEPDQYIRTTCGYDYVPYYCADKVQDLRDLIDSIFPSPAIRDYYLSVLATGLFGLQIENLFIATGTGGNGKSLLNALMMDCVGAYGYKLGANVLLDEIKDGPNPAIACLNNKRFVLVQEPNGNRRVCTATLKEITGDKTINARMNYSNDCVANMTLTLVMECNELPPLDEVGGGVERRIRAVPFVNRFIPADTYAALEDKTGVAVANPYYKTPEFQQQHRQALFEILRPYWERFQRNGDSVPDLPAECKVITTDYLAVSDDIFAWFSSIYEKGDPGTDMVFVDEIYTNLTTSTLWDNMSKADRRKNSKSAFTKKVEKNIFLRQFYKPRDAYFAGAKKNRPFIVGFKPVAVEDLDDESD